MIVRQRLGSKPRGLVDYVLRWRTDDMRHGADTVLLASAGLPDGANMSVDEARLLFIAAADGASHLKRTVVHVILAPSADWVRRTGLEQAKAAVIVALAHATRRVGLGDRLMIAAFHHDTGIPHLHAAIALPSPETGISIPHHRLSERLRDAVDELGPLLGWSDDRVSVPPAARDVEQTAKADPRPWRPPLLNPPERTQARSRARRRSQEIEI